ncbi:MAG: hypothetical protein HOV66_26590 [Streptomycetaceae bacterium]|jgi:hypothetical protein|nr:hypothetical protein [Streptomycetaceae bacterium]NUS58389.1 hypothetical protein [Streptomycetaceae bacterium]
MPDQDTATGHPAVPKPRAPRTPPADYGVDLEDPAARSPRVQLAAAVVAMLLIVGVGLHLLFVTLHVAPESRASRKYAGATDSWIYPLFEQNWRLFAPNPLNLNIRVNARAQVRAADGSVTETPWIDLTGDDIDHIRGNPFPSKADQNMLRRAWDFYSGSHNNDETPSSGQAGLAEDYLRSIVVHRLRQEGRADGVVAVQVRSVSTAIPEPGAAASGPSIRELGWWETRPDDFR